MKSQRLQRTNQLVGKEQHGLEGELSVAEVEQVLEGGAALIVSRANYHRNTHSKSNTMAL